MSVFLTSGPTDVEYRPKLASTVFANQSLVDADGTGFVQPATAASNFLIGVCMRPVSAADADFAAATPIPLTMPMDDTVFKMSVTTGVLTSAMIGLRFDLTDASGVDVTANAKKVVTCTGFISATQGYFKINSSESNANHI